MTKDKAISRVRILASVGLLLCFLYLLDLFIWHRGSGAEEISGGLWVFFSLYSMIPEGVIFMYLLALSVGSVYCLQFKRLGYRLYLTFFCINLAIIFLAPMMNIMLQVTPYYDSHFIKGMTPLLVFTIFGLILLNNKEVKCLFGIKSPEQILKDHGISLEKQALEKALFHDDFEIKIIAAEELKKFGNKTSVKILMKALSPDEKTEGKGELKPDDAAGRFLGPVGLGAVGSAFRPRAYKNPKAVYRSAILETLSSLGDESILPEITKLLTDTNEMVKAHAIRTLKKVGGVLAVPCIINCLKDFSSIVRGVALRALVELTKKEFLKNTYDKEEQEEAIRLYREWWKSYKKVNITE